MAASVEIIASVGINCPLLFQLAYLIGKAPAKTAVPLAL